MRRFASRVGRGLLLALALSTAPPSGRLTAQVPRPAAAPDSLRQALEFERRADFTDAVVAYQHILARDPANEGALLGLERSLTPLGLQREMIPFLGAALAVRRTSLIYSIALRVWNAAGASDSLRATAAAWAGVEEDKTIPYRAWGDLLLQRRDFGGARNAYLAGRAAAGDPMALSAELAQVAQLQGDLPGSAREWLRAVRLSPGYRATAVAALAPARDKDRDEILRVLAGDPEGQGTLLSAVLLAQWGEPLRGAELLQRALADTAAAPGAREDLLASFIAQVRTLGTRDAKLALGASLELLGAHQASIVAARTRLEAARAFADGGDAASARRMLALVAGDHGAPAALAEQAASTLLEIQIASGQLDDAEHTFADRAAKMGGDERASVRRRIAEGWIRQGALDRADRLAAGDSTVDGMALAGRLALYRGDLKSARTLLRSAGPYAGTREEATARTALLALVQPIEADSLPALGAALLAGERGDTVAAITGLDHAAEGLAPARGGAALRLAAAELAWAHGASADAERRLKEVAATAVPATAPAAELDLGRLLVALGRRPEAVAQLEHLILTYPGSAFIPQARRLLDEARGGVPTT